MSPSIVYLTVLIASSVGLVFELLAGTIASYLLGDTVTQLATVTGVFLTSLGMGAWLTRYLTLRPADRFLECQIASALTGGLTGPLLFLTFSRTTTLLPILYGLVALTGVLTGVQIPLMLRVLRRRSSFRELTARMLTVDYAGALLGSLAFGLVALPHLGMVRAGIVAGLVSTAMAFWGTWALGSAVASPGALRFRAAMVMAVLTLSLATSTRLSALADDAVFAEPVVFAEQSLYQRIVVTRGHGGMNLFLDNNLQFASVDEYRYHEALVHPAFAAAPRHADVLILGGGDGLAAREVLRYADVESVTLVDLDPSMTGLSRVVPWLHDLNQGSFDDPRMHVVNDDAMVWLAESKLPAHSGGFDIAVVDFPDPNNFALGKLYTARFYKLLRARLAADGVVVVQSTSPLVARKSFWCIERTLAAAGFATRPYHALVPSFGEWGYVLAAPGPIQPFKPLPKGLRYLTDEILPQLFALSPDMTEVPVEVNHLNNQVLVHYYEDEWRRYLH
jgi:spermidine synthase